MKIKPYYHTISEALQRIRKEVQLGNLEKVKKKIFIERIMKKNFAFMTG